MTNLFDNETTVSFDDLVGDGKKYADKEAAAKAIAEKDRFIEQLKQEAAEAREAARQARDKAAETANLQAFKDRMDELDRKYSTLSPEGRNQPSPAREPEPQVDIAERVAAEVQRLSAQEKAASAARATEAKLLEVLGPDYKTVVKQRAQELGVGINFLNEAALVGPQVVLNLLGIDGTRKAPEQVAPPPTRHNAASFVPNTGVKNYSYYKQMAKENPTLYNTPAIQLEEMKEAVRLGADFYK